MSNLRSKRLVRRYASAVALPCGTLPAGFGGSGHVIDERYPGAPPC